MIDLLGIYITAPLYAAGLLTLGIHFILVFIFHIVVVPLIFKYSKAFRRTLVFANFVQWPMFFNYDHPSVTGLKGVRNLNLEYESKVDKCPVKIGIWHVLPKTVYERIKNPFEDSEDREAINKLLDEELATTKNPIVMYFHGNSNNRATGHRLLLYKFFQDMNFHTIAFDYRGYGDSTNIRPTEAGVVEDSLIVYAWLLDTTRKNGQEPPIFIWGHSLGTGISSSLLGNLKDLSRLHLDDVPLPLPNGLILEAPFNNLADEVANHPAARLVTWLPYFDATFVSPFRSHTEQRFCSDENLKRVSDLPVLILHAKDDYTVPFIVGLKLYKSLLEARKNGGAPVKLHAYEKIERLGHRYICLAPDLRIAVGDFVTTHLRT